jgi:hypothetical protein
LRGAEAAATATARESAAASAKLARRERIIEQS